MDSAVLRSHGWRNILNIPYGLGPTETRILWPRSQSHQSRHWQIHAPGHWRFVRSTSIRRRHRYRHRRVHRALWQRPQRQPQLSHEPCRLGAHWQCRSCVHPRWVNSPRRWLRKLSRCHGGRNCQPTRQRRSNDADNDYERQDTIIDTKIYTRGVRLRLGLLWLGL